MNTSESPARSRPGLWGGLWIGNICAIIGLKFSGAIEEPVPMILLALAMLLFIPFIRATNRSWAERGCASSAILEYNKGMAISSIGYVLGLGVAITVFNRTGAEGAAAFGLALLPIAPILYMIYVMGRYLAQERDEYLRHRAINASLAGLGVVLALGSFWGFLETFGVVPHAPGWMAVPVWAIGMGLFQGWSALRNRSTAADDA